MMTINLGNGFMDVIRGHDVVTGWMGHGKKMGLPNGRYSFEWRQQPPISDVYSLLVKCGCTQDQVMDSLIARYLPFKFFRVGHLSKMELVYGFIGPRGSGKTAGAVGVIVLDYLLDGFKCWSNVPISVRVCYKDAERIYASEPLEKLNLMKLNEDFRNGVVLVDECNMEVAEATRSMSSANLGFSYALQQIRKRHLHVIWTAQSERWVDNRLRWQTDFYISCRDAFLKHSYNSHGLGEMSTWRVMDVSGITGFEPPGSIFDHKWLEEFTVWQGAVMTKLFWDAYDTSLLQGKEDYRQAYKRSLKEDAAAARTVELPPPGQDYAKSLVNLLGDAEMFYADELWQTNGITDRATQTLVGAELARQGWKKKRQGDGRYYYQRVLTEAVT